MPRDYTIEREYEDVAEVVDTLAEQWDGAVDVLGHSLRRPLCPRRRRR